MRLAAAQTAHRASARGYGAFVPSRSTTTAIDRSTDRSFVRTSARLSARAREPSIA
jgi:hypothetical protein